MKRVASIQDISCLGRCSLTVALPVISAMEVECAILPTAVLSAHTMFPDILCRDLTADILPIARYWQSQQVQLDAVYTGYLVSPTGGGCLPGVGGAGGAGYPTLRGPGHGRWGSALHGL